MIWWCIFSWSVFGLAANIPACVSDVEEACPAEHLPSGLHLLQKGSTSKRFQTSHDLRDTSATVSLPAKGKIAPEEGRKEPLTDELQYLKKATLAPLKDGKLDLTSQHVAPVCGVLWFYHIGKCAGTSILQWFRELKEKDAVQIVFDVQSDMVDVNFTEFNNEYLQPLVHNMTGKLVAVHHHHRGPGLYGLDPYFSDLKKQLNSQGCSLIRWTLLREPVSRLKSAVNFELQLHHRSIQSKVAYDQAFREYLLESGVTDFENRRDNAQVRYTLNNFGIDAESKFSMPFGSSNEAALDAATRILDSFEVVGTVEEVDKSIKNVTKLLELPDVPLPTDNARRKQYQKYDDLPLPDDIQRLIEKRTRLEAKLYERFASKSRT
mmetsp:Transcript_75913/g.144397  ORF Transcript_75913/g.144397 Transcript_75913/m.144397 type:complete len:378 (-) Transcript_75913:67-1200(-)